MNNHLQEQLIIAINATNELQTVLETESIDSSMRVAKLSRLNTIALKAIEFVLFMNNNNNNEMHINNINNNNQMKNINNNNNVVGMNINNNNNNNYNNRKKKTKIVCKYWQADCCSNYGNCLFWHPTKDEMELFKIEKKHCPYGVDCKKFVKLCDCANKINNNNNRKHNNNNSDNNKFERKSEEKNNEIVENKKKKEDEAGIFKNKNDIWKKCDLEKKGKKKRKRRKKNKTGSESETENEKEGEKHECENGNKIENKNKCKDNQENVMEAIYDEEGRIIQIKKSGIGLLTNNRRKSGLNNILNNEKESEFRIENKGMNEKKSLNNSLNKKKSKKERYITSRMYNDENDFDFEDEFGNENLSLYELEQYGFFDRYGNENDYDI